ncbi:hypothetical protein [Sulfurimonas marina]|uniref:Uncharacterized protein n=1 Tax=Sulfurimonas marina TaxID=2590551 RepID=A0A7M3V9C7_9BACT|nr:hypothetical protein [Sulfurimonas marina]QOP40360.1 hypothetical protein FJR03_00805 [Sulfurimonas marina]
MSPAQECKEILKQEGINLLSSVDFDVNGEETSLTLEYIIDTYMLASEESQLVFLTAMKKSLEANTIGIEKFFEGMGQLLLMSHLSDKFEG